MFRVAENLAIDRIRQRRARSRLDQLDADEFFEESGIERAVLALLKAAITELPDKYHVTTALVIDPTRDQGVPG